MSFQSIGSLGTLLQFSPVCIFPSVPRCASGLYGFSLTSISLSVYFSSCASVFSNQFSHLKNVAIELVGGHTNIFFPFL